MHTAHSSTRRFHSSLAAFLLACVWAAALFAAAVPTSLRAQSADNPGKADAGLKVATFAGGCFWCMQYAFDPVKGVRKTVAGYTGGPEKDPTYEQVSAGRTGHAESVEVYYDPAEVSYEKLLEVFWANIDPTQQNGQFADHGKQYRSVIFTRGDEQQRLAEASKAALARSGEFAGKPIATAIAPVGAFYPAEEYHQEYYRKNPAEFHAYHVGSGRAGYVAQRAEKAKARSAAANAAGAVAKP